MPLIRVSVGDGDCAIVDDDFTDFDVEMPRLQRESTRSLNLAQTSGMKPRTKRLTALALVTMGTALLVSMLLSNSSGGPLYANVQARTVKVISGPMGGIKVLKFPTNGTFQRFSKGSFDKIYTGDAVAVFKGQDGTLANLTWPGEDGVLLSLEPLKPGDAVTTGTPAISMGKALFHEFIYPVGSKVGQGATVIILWMGYDKDGLMITKEVPASANYTIVGTTDITIQDPIGYGYPLTDDQFLLMGTAMPPLPPCPGSDTDCLVEHKGSKWLMFKRYTVDKGDQVVEGDTVAQAYYVKQTTAGYQKGDLVNFTAHRNGSILAMQNISAGGPVLVAPNDDIVTIGTGGPGFPWWLLLLLLLCCLLCILLFCCCGGKKEEPAPAPVAAPPAAVKAAPAAVVAAAPAPVVAAAAAPVVAAAAPVAAAPPPPGVPIYFDNKPYYVEYQPLGIKFHTTTPVKCDDYIFNSYGKTLGIPKGSKLTRIRDIDVSNNHHISDVEEKLHNAIKDLPYWPLRIDFKVPNTNQIKTYYFKEKPIGIMFTQHAPIKVEKFRPYSLAQRETDIAVGYEITRIADEETATVARNSTSNKATYTKVDEHLNEGLAHLPNWAVKLEFKAGGQTKLISFMKKPHGMTFHRKGEMYVEKVKPGSAAESLGVQAGWTLTKIMNDVVTASTDHKNAEKEINEMMKHLPDH